MLLRYTSTKPRLHRYSTIRTNASKSSKGGLHPKTTEMRQIPCPRKHYYSIPAGRTAIYSGSRVQSQTLHNKPTDAMILRRRHLTSMIMRTTQKLASASTTGKSVVIDRLTVMVYLAITALVFVPERSICRDFRGTISNCHSALIVEIYSNFVIKSLDSSKCRD